MNAVYIQARDTYVCPVCEEDLHYWTAYDVLFCPNCMGETYDPDTGEAQGSFV